MTEDSELDEVIEKLFSFTPDPEVLRSRVQQLIWHLGERYAYADKKFNDKNHLDQHIADTGFTEDGWYMGFIGNYIKRAQLLGADTPAGRQAMGKAIVTMVEALEAAIRVYGPMPEPGHSSGEIREWELHA